MYSPSIKIWKINLIIQDKKEYVHIDFLFRCDLYFSLTEYLH